MIDTLVRTLARGSWVLAVLCAASLTLAVLTWYAHRTVFDTDGFADRVDASLQQPAVSTEIARRAAAAAIAARPDLVAVRPLLESAAQAVVAGPAFRSLARGAARDVHRSVFDSGAGTVTLTVSDAGVLLAEALRHQRPDLASEIPANLRVRVGGVTDDAQRAAVRAVALGDRIRSLALLSLLAAFLLGAATVAVTRPRRVALLRLGLATAVLGGLALVAVELAPRALTSSAAEHALLSTWLDPLLGWCSALCAAGAICALAAGSAARPVDLPALGRRGFAAVRGARDPRLRAARALAAVALGVALIAWPERLLEIVAVSAGLALVLAGVSELFRLAGTPAPAPRVAGPRRRGGRIAALAAMLIGALAAAVVVAGAGAAAPVRVGRCNGSEALCDRPLDTVAFVGTHNSMSADGEPGWLFAAQDAGIDAQLADGVRALLIDTHYGFATPRGVATDLSRESISRAKVVAEAGEQFVQTAERLRARIGYNGGGTREVFLCHAFCEVGATRAVTALAGVHRFLVAHPEEVLILSIEDDTDPQDTEAVIRESGLVREVYRGSVTGPWPTLRTMIERDERVLVLVENHPGPEPWMHRQPAVVQETPYHFGDASALAAPASCAPNRGGTAGPLMLLNHWVDTSPAPRRTIAREVNAAAFLDARLAHCRAQHRPSPNILAVDFYREGDAFAVARRLDAAPVTQHG